MVDSEADTGLPSNERCLAMASSTSSRADVARAHDAAAWLRTSEVAEPDAPACSSAQTRSLASLANKAATVATMPQILVVSFVTHYTIIQEVTYRSLSANAHAYIDSANPIPLCRSCEAISSL